MQTRGNLRQFAGEKKFDDLKVQLNRIETEIFFLGRDLVMRVHFRNFFDSFGLVRTKLDQKARNFPSKILSHICDAHKPKTDEFDYKKRYAKNKIAKKLQNRGFAV